MIPRSPPAAAAAHPPPTSPEPAVASPSTPADSGWLYRDEEDRKRLERLPQLEREQILSERFQRHLPCDPISGRRSEELEMQQLVQARRPSKEAALADIHKRRSEKAGGATPLQSIGTEKSKPVSESGSEVSDRESEEEEEGPDFYLHMRPPQQAKVRRSG